MRVGKEREAYDTLSVPVEIRWTSKHSKRHTTVVNKDPERQFFFQNP